MKKILTYFLGFIFICFILPAICTKTIDVKNSNTTVEVGKQEETIKQNDEEQEQNNESHNIEEETPINVAYDYKQYNTIKLLHTGSGEIGELGLDEYLYGVVSAEMPASYEIEAIKAQAVVARTYTIYQIQNSKAKQCDLGLPK